MKPLFSILLAAKRIEGSKQLLDSIIKTHSGQHQMQLICYVDDGDDELRNMLHSYPFPENFTCETTNDKGRDAGWRGCWWNFMYPLSKADLIFPASDDLLFQTPNWDLRIKEEFDKYEDKLVLFHVQDGGPINHCSKLATILFLSKQWCDTLGYVMPWMFYSLYCDTWLTYIADYNKRRVFIPDIHIEHVHWWFRKTSADAVHHKNNEHNHRSKKIWEATKAQRVADAQKIQARLNEHS